MDRLIIGGHTRVSCRRAERTGESAYPTIGAVGEQFASGEEVFDPIEIDAIFSEARCCISVLCAGTLAFSRPRFRMGRGGGGCLACASVAPMRGGVTASDQRDRILPIC